MSSALAFHFKECYEDIPGARSALFFYAQRLEEAKIERGKLYPHSYGLYKLTTTCNSALLAEQALAQRAGLNFSGLKP